MNQKTFAALKPRGTGVFTIAEALLKEPREYQVSVSTYMYWKDQYMMSGYPVVEYEFNNRMHLYFHDQDLWLYAT